MESASALVASLIASLLLNYYFIPPLHTFTIGEPNNVIALVVFAVVALTVSTVVDRAARQTVRAARATAEAETLSTLAGSVLRGAGAATASDAAGAVPDGVRAGLRRAARPDQDGEVLARSDAGGTAPAAHGREATEVPVGAGRVAHAVRPSAAGRTTSRVLTAFAAHVAAALERDRLAAVAAEVEPIKAADRMRTALLAAVSHDLRTPLAAALRRGRLAAQPGRRVLVRGPGRTAGHRRRVADQADPAGRQPARHEPPAGRRAHPAPDAGPPATRCCRAPLRLAAPRIAADPRVAPPCRPVQPLDLAAVPPVLADPPLLERVLANVITNALRYNAPGAPVLVTASAHLDRVEIRIVDRGPGIPAADRTPVFLPFQRLGDTDNTTGVGLGLALSRGLAEAMGGTLEVEDTPGGGTTMLLTLPAEEGP